ncbi:MAG: hypothetical protein OXU74_00310 [Gemmatimonadota bacterium]|nr:hypothetical protein [Gemmatimonadota bacterium]
MTRFLRPALIGIFGASVLATAGCASRGQIPEIATLAPYNGEWVLEGVQSTGLQFVSPEGSGFARGTGQRLVAALGIRAERFVLEASDSVFRVSSDEPDYSFTLPIDGTPIEVRAEDGGLEQSIALGWDSGMPVVRRTLPDSGWVSERFGLTAEGALIITRTAARTNNRGMDVRATGAVDIVYVRGTGP